MQDVAFIDPDFEVVGGQHYAFWAGAQIDGSMSPGEADGMVQNTDAHMVVRRLYL